MRSLSYKKLIAFLIIGITSFFITNIARSEESKKAGEYHESLNALNGQIEKIRENQEKIDRLVKEKNHSADRARIAEIIAEINLIQDEQQELQKSSRALQYDIKYRFPAKGEETDRIYKRWGLQDGEEQEVPLSVRLSEVLSYAKRVYGPTEAELRAAEAEARRLQEEAEKKANDPRSRFERIRVSH